MKPEKLDRRIVRSRRRLSEALLELMHEEQFESITIQQIADRADLNRATFYLHYSTKEELLIASLETRFDQLVQDIEAEAPTENLLEDCMAEHLVFKHVHANADLYRVILGDRGMGTVTNRIIKYIAAVGLRDLKKAGIKKEFSKVPPEILAYQYAGGLFAVLTWWIENDFPHSPEEMAKIVHRVGLFGCVPMLSEIGNISL